jgi:membrane-bound ClpP family serine protease
MGIGSGIFLFVVGAILTFALNVQVEWANLDLIGYLLMGAGVVVFLISLVMVMRKRSTTSTVRHVDSAGGERVTQREDRSDPADPMV